MCFQDLTDELIAIIYMDDVFLFAKDLATLENNTKKVLQRLQENDLYLKPKKCKFAKTKVEWLGMVIKDKGSLESESRTWTWLVSPAPGHEKKNGTQKIWAKFAYFRHCRHLLFMYHCYFINKVHKIV